jgi:uncharacterized protein YjbI with pentapeptide repeats
MEENNLFKCSICGKPTHKESKYCIFHASAEEKTEREFKEALNKYVDKVKKEDGDYNFKGFIFVGDINFEKDLKITSFKSVDFRNVVFKGSANFKNTTFEEVAAFNSTTFEGITTFDSAIFKEDTIFNLVTFDEDTSFWRVTFKKSIFFDGTTFKGDAQFGVTIFERFAMFVNATFEGNVSFRYATLPSGNKLDIKVKKKGIINFIYTKLENVFLDLNLDRRVLIDFTNALLRNTQIKKDQIENHLLHEKKKKFSQAKEIFLLLKNNFHSIGRYDDESWAYKKEKDMERLSQSFPYYKATLKNENKKESFPIIKWIQKGNFKKWITSAFSNMIYGYGEKPWNVIKTAVAIILIFALSFSFIGLGNPEIIELKGTAIHQNSGKVVDLTSKGFLKNNLIRNFPDSLYFSLITFTTLGYGDFRPLEGIGRILAGSEAFIGAIMMALFVYTFARRTGGR